MSVVCAKVYDDKVVMAADSQVTWGSHIKNNIGFSKIKEINGIIIGAVGNCDEASLMYQYAKTHKPDNSNEKDVLEFIAEFAKWKKDYDGNNTINNHYLLIYDGNLFYIEGILVNEINDFAAIGSGFSFALTALFLDKSPKEAVKVTCKLDCFVGEPIIEFEMKRHIKS
jgi:ATP-dependent protease HslVU (ClpYQ) peptidase subunit